eukprot:6522134-Prymnesium_polylepis.1
MSCRDGSDLLEGPLDDYTDCDEASRLCALTKKCRARCARRVSCAYYTTYASGFCQLSSRCEEEMRAADASARTFRKRPAAVPASVPVKAVLRIRAVCRYVRDTAPLLEALGLAASSTPLWHHQCAPARTGDVLHP